MSDYSQYELLWKKILERAEPHINAITFSAYIQSLVPVDVVNRKLVLRADTEMAAGTVEKYLPKLREALAAAEVGLTDLVITVEGSEEHAFDEEPDEAIEHDNMLNPHYTFDSFVVGSSNKFVFAAAQSVTQAPGENFNPLYIYGGTGLGKTHLMQAIANHIQQKKPSLTVIYTTSENFLNEYVDSMLGRKNGAAGRAETKFKNRYRNVDVLLIDDIQFWAGKRGVQEAFFHAFNDLYAKNKQIVISSDCPAKDLTELEERLRTRFEGGLIADIQPPDLETKIAILKRKALEKKCVVPDDVLEMLAKNSDNNVRTLEGRLNTVIFASKLHEEPISLSLAATAFRESTNTNAEEQEDVTPEAIIRATCAHFNISEKDLLGKNKKQEIVRPRQICTYLMCDMLSIPLKNIGLKMGRKDHTTIIYTRDKIAELIRVNDAVLKDVNDIKSIILKQ